MSNNYEKWQIQNHNLKELSSKTDLAEVVSLDGYQLKGVTPRFPADFVYLSSLMWEAP
jgi:hypothetical protein